MKATELMIGDWVIDTYTNKPMRMSGVNSLMGDGLEPIPLTPEILEKNGFSERYSGGEHTMHYSIYEDNNGDFDLWITDGIRKGSTCGEVREFIFTALRYVHQLQHALRLCGMEKEIEL